MNLDTLIAWLPAIFRYAADIKAILDAAASNVDVVTKIKQLAPGLASILESIGVLLFPKVATGLHVAAVATAAFDPNITKWVQGACNKLVMPSPNLDVDGIYGPKTRAAVEQLQTKLGLVVDGWAGQITQAAIAKLLTA